MLGHGIFHAAGIIRGNSGYLFVGPSGSGKSTVAHLSATRGHTILHDDQVVVWPARPGEYVVKDLFSMNPDSPLKAIFFLLQDTIDRLDPLSTQLVAKRSLESFLDSSSRSVLFGPILRSAFASCVTLARSVPGYELHFRKSPGFWDVIDAESGI